MHLPPFPLEHVVSLVGHSKFPIVAGTSPENQHCFRGEGDESSLKNTKSATCPRTFGEYCTCTQVSYRFRRLCTLTKTLIKTTYRSPRFGPLQLLSWHFSLRSGHTLTNTPNTACHQKADLFYDWLRIPRR